MKNQTLKSYVNSKMLEYLKKYYKNVKSLRYKKLFELSSKDIRLAELSYAYFWTKNQQEKAKTFEVYTKENLNSYDDFEKSDQKYAFQFRQKKLKKQKAKEFLYELTLQKIKEYELSFYYVSKHILKTNQSNVSQFYNKKNYNALSLEKLSYLNEWLSSNNFKR